MSVGHGDGQPYHQELLGSLLLADCEASTHFRSPWVWVIIVSVPKTSKY